MVRFSESSQYVLNLILLFQRDAEAWQVQVCSIDSQIGCRVAIKDLRNRGRLWLFGDDLRLGLSVDLSRVNERDLLANFRVFYCTFCFWLRDDISSFVDF